MYRLGEGISIWQAELYAIYKGCTWIINNPEEVVGEKVVFNVDSRSAIEALEQVNFNSEILGRTIDALMEAAEICIGQELKGSLIIRWVKSHQDNNPLYIGNCNADALAVDAAKSDRPIEPDAPNVAKGTWKLDLRIKVDNFWEYLWWLLEHPNACRQTKHWFPYPQASKSFRLVNLARQKYGIMVQFITGHNYLNRHEFLIRGPDDEEVDPMCQLCDYNYSQTSAHIIRECAALVEPRLEVFGLHVMEPPFNFPIRTIIKFLEKAEVEALSMKRGQGVNQTS